MHTLTKLVAAATLVAAVPAAATVIDFNDRPGGAQPSPFVYPEATFTSSTGQLFVGAAAIAKEICPLTASFNCVATLTVDFTGSVNGLTFEVSGDDADSSTLSVAYTTTSGAGVFNFGAFDGTFNTAHLVDMSAISNLTQLVLTSDDPAGLAYNRFTFTPNGGGAVPEPATWALLILGFGAVGAAMRRRTTLAYA